jgi:hypothetical protein
MAMSRIAVLLLLCGGPAAAQISAPNAAQALEQYRQTFTPVAEIDCPRDGKGDIVVCGSRADPANSRYAPFPGDRVRMTAGEAPRASVGHGEGRYCFQKCADMVGIDIGMAKQLVSGIKRLIRGDD